MLVFFVDLTKLTNVFPKLTYVSILLVSGSGLFDSFILYYKKFFNNFCSTE